MIIKRFLAYIIDIMIILFICTIFNMLLPIQTNDLNHSLNMITEAVLKHSISIREYLNNVILINYKIDRLNITYQTINIMVIIIYFIIVPIINDGKTIGLSLFKLKIKGNINLKNLVIRNIFTTGLLYMILSVILIHILDYRYYFIFITILSFVQLLLVIISSFMIIYRRDKKGMQDVFSSTYIEKVK